MNESFAAAVEHDRCHPIWSGDIAALGDKWPDATEFREATIELDAGIAIVRFSRFVTAAGWKQLAAVVNEAVADQRVKSVMLCIDVIAAQAAGLNECVAMIRKLATRKPIVAHIANCYGGAMLLIKACTRSYADREAKFGGAVSATPFVNSRSK